MLLYNVTVNIEKDIEEDWIIWMKGIHIPDVLATGMFTENKIYKILHDTEDGSVNYSVQYFADSMEKIMEYQRSYAPKLQQDTKERFGEKLITFRTLLEMID
ncbi:DUF4286 family protein [Cecembia sp.]|uniref:DUF4286 family protein n=1 Tax=Cecembia sp. TaxID=1898110 RepID=UPI0025C3D9AD|nr:DUF4286 family protein [Cecembia sp.]